MRVTIRLLTAIALIIISGVAVAQGWGIVRFFLASMNIVSSEKRARIADAWRATSGITSTVLKDELADETNQSDVIAAYRQRELLSAILSIEPLSSMDWFTLSRSELITHQPMEQVLESIKLSVLTGPNEGYIMAERGTFAVSLWENLSPDFKARAALDLAYSRSSADDAKTQKLRTVISSKPDWVRNELGKAILATGFSPKEIDPRLGP